MRMHPRKTGSELHRTLDLSAHARVLIVGDVHGQFRKLDEALSAIEYTPDRDALVFAGDLIDRGPSSPEAFDWIDRENIHRILGNHDIMPGMYADEEIDVETAIQWGGRWFAERGRDEAAIIATTLEDAPVALTVLTPTGHRIGIVHADCGSDWTDHVAAIGNDEDPTHHEAIRRSLWSRQTIEMLVDAARRRNVHRSDQICTMTGIDHVFHGHTPVTKAFTHGDRTWLDTGACYGNDITVIDADRWLACLNPHRIYPTTRSLER